MSLPRTITAIHDAFDKKTLSATELTRDYLQAAKASKHNAYISFLEERALAQAARADQTFALNGKVDRSQHPLHGIPLGIKDILTMDGTVTTCASKMLENYVAPYTATSVERLENAGAISLGKLNMDEFAMGGSNENSAFGPVLHPTHEGYVPGGSSGGSVTAVKAGLCVASLGTDTGGSIRLPAHFTGTVGMKPTYGRVSRYGLIAFSSSLDQIGPIANSVEDAAIVLQAMAGHDPKDSTSSSRPLEDLVRATRQEPDWKNLRIGVPKEYWVDGISADIGASVREALKFFEKKGAKIVDVSLPHTKYSVSVYYIVAVSEASSNLSRFDGVRFGVRKPGADEMKDLADFYKKIRSNFGAEVKRRIILGTFALSSGYYDAYFKKACQVRRLIQQDFERAFQSCDVMVAPVSPTTAFKIGEKSADPLKMYLNDILTIPANLAGLPALSVPCGKDAAGLPIGLHMIAPQFADASILSVAAAYEREHKA